MIYWQDMEFLLWKDFEYGEFLLEYAGELIDPGIADTREQTYEFYFLIGKDQYRWIFASVCVSVIVIFSIAAYLDIFQFPIFAVFAHICIFCTSLARRFIRTFVWLLNTDDTVTLWLLPHMQDGSPKNLYNTNLMQQISVINELIICS